MPKTPVPFPRILRWIPDGLTDLLRKFVDFDLKETLYHGLNFQVNCKWLPALCVIMGFACVSNESFRNIDIDCHFLGMQGNLVKSTGTKEEDWAKSTSSFTSNDDGTKLRTELNEFCWNQDNFLVTRGYGRGTWKFPYPGISDVRDKDDTVKLGYYKYIWFIFFVDACILYFPLIVLRATNFKNKMKDILKRNRRGRTKDKTDETYKWGKPTVPISNPPTPKDKEGEEEVIRDGEKRADALVKRFVGCHPYNLGSGLKYLATELTIPACLLVADFLMGFFLEPNLYRYYGWNVTEYMLATNKEYLQNPMEELFPRNGKCVRKNIGIGGDVERTSAICQLPMNAVTMWCVFLVWWGLRCCWVPSLALCVWDLTLCICPCVRALYWKPCIASACYDNVHKAVMDKRTKNQRGKLKMSRKAHKTTAKLGFRSKMEMINLKLSFGDHLVLLFIQRAVEEWVFTNFLRKLVQHKSRPRLIRIGETGQEAEDDVETGQETEDEETDPKTKAHKDSSWDRDLNIIPSAPSQATNEKNAKKSTKRKQEKQQKERTKCKSSSKASQSGKDQDQMKTELEKNENPAGNHATEISDEATKQETQTWPPSNKPMERVADLAGPIHSLDGTDPLLKLPTNNNMGWAVNVDIGGNLGETVPEPSDFLVDLEAGTGGTESLTLNQSDNAIIREEVKVNIDPDNFHKTTAIGWDHTMDSQIEYGWVQNLRPQVNPQCIIV